MDWSKISKYMHWIEQIKDTLHVVEPPQDDPGAFMVGFSLKLDVGLLRTVWNVLFGVKNIFPSIEPQIIADLLNQIQSDLVHEQPADIDVILRFKPLAAQGRRREPEDVQSDRRA